MRRTNLILPAAALGLAVLVLAPRDVGAFTLIGGKLNLSQRDVRLFNNFSSPTANANTTQTADWPGYDGAELAVWKAVGEWASEPHGLTGAGDPSQPILGSGGANFDATWQGNATGVGGSEDNIMSEISGSNGGIYAFAEGGGGGGWRIRFWSTWNWSDDPVGPAAGNIDLQGVATHEYGHALRLAHSTANGSTMQTVISGSGVAARSINGDDQAGVQAIYGVIDGSKKPHIESVTGTGQPFVITGTEFLVTGMEVWFTQVGTSADGVPIKVTGLTSNGTSLTVFAPAAAGPGDLLLRKTGVIGPKGMSNAFPVNPLLCNRGNSVSYCFSGISASGCEATLSSVGTASSTSGLPFTLDVTDLEGNKDGLLFFGTNGRQINTWGNGSSFQCVVPPVKRTGLQSGSGTPGQCDGSFSLDFNAWMAAHPASAPAPGTVVDIQTWYRDPQNTSNQTTSLSSALEFVVCD